MRSQVFVLAALLGAAQWAVAAGEGEHNRYKWRDGQGNLHFDDALPVEALQFGYDVVNPQGLLIKHVERAKTEQELKIEQAEAEKRAEQRRIEDERTRADQQLLAAYPTEADLVSSQQAQFTMLDQNITATNASMESQEKSLAEILAHAADLDRNGKPVPPALKSQIDTLRRNIEKQKGYIASKEQEKIDAAKRFQADLAHYRALQERIKARDSAK